MPIEGTPHNDRDFTNMQMDVFDRVLRIHAANVSHRPAGCIEIDTEGENGRNAPEHTARRAPEVESSRCAGHAAPSMHGGVGPLITSAGPHDLTIGHIHGLTPSSSHAIEFRFFQLRLVIILTPPLS